MVSFFISSQLPFSFSKTRASIRNNYFFLILIKKIIICFRNWLNFINNGKKKLKYIINEISQNCVGKIQGKLHIKKTIILQTVYNRNLD